MQRKKKNKKKSMKRREEFFKRKVVPLDYSEAPNQSIRANKCPEYANRGRPIASNALGLLGLIIIIPVH